MEKCKLCGSNLNLIEGHIIPKFVVKYLKETSVTGRVRQAEKPNLRKQDIIKFRLLCFNCEQLFSKREKIFSEQIFKKYHHQKIWRFDYQEWLRYFLISVFWKIAIKEIDSFAESKPALGIFVQNAIDKWTPFLLGESNSPGDYQCNIIINVKIEANHPQVPEIERLNWHLLRGIDATIKFSTKTVGIYFRIPGFLFYCHLKPNKSNQWKNTKIGRKGTISLPQHIKDKHFGSFLRERLKFSAESMNGISERQWAKIADSYRNNFDVKKHKNILDILMADRKSSNT